MAEDFTVEDLIQRKKLIDVNALSYYHTKSLAETTKLYVEKDKIGAGLNLATDGTLSAQLATEIVSDNSEPSDPSVKLWITSSGDNIAVPQIDDDNANAYDTWSSQKIKQSIQNVAPIVKTTAEWNLTPSLQSAKGVAYIYSDYKTIDGKKVAGIKIGDGNAYVVDLPFVNTVVDVDGHTPTAENYVSAEDREKLDRSISCKIAESDENTLVFF